MSNGQSRLQQQRPKHRAEAGAEQVSILDQVLESTKQITLGPNGFQAKTLFDCLEIAKLYFEGGLAPKQMDTVAKIAIAIEHGSAIGLSASQAVQSIAVINGRPTIWGDAMIGLCLASPVCEEIHEYTEGKGEDYTAVCVAKRKGSAEPVVKKFGVKQAKRAGLWGKEGPWRGYPDRMLQMRARGFALRDAFADVLKGLQCREEVEDLDSIRTADGLDASRLSVAKTVKTGSPLQAKLDAVSALDADAIDAAMSTPADKLDKLDAIAHIEEKLHAAQDDNALADLVDAYTSGPDGEGLTAAQIEHIHNVAAEISQRRAALAEHPAPPKKGGKQKSAIAPDGVGQ